MDEFRRTDDDISFYLLRKFPGTIFLNILVFFFTGKRFFFYNTQKNMKKNNIGLIY